MRAVMSGPRRAPAVEAGDSGTELVAGDSARVADQVDEREHEFVVVDSFDVTTAGFGWRPDGHERRAGEEVPVTEHARPRP